MLAFKNEFSAIALSVRYCSSVCLSIVLLCSLCMDCVGQSSLPVDPGEVVATCCNGYEGQCPGPLDGDAPVLVLFDTRDPVGQGAVLDVNWAAPSFHNEPIGNPHFWSARNLGQVYGVALDEETNPNIYVTATRMYGDWPDDEPGLWGPGGPGGVYKIDGSTGNICVLASLPQPATSPGTAMGTGLGTLATMTTTTGTGLVFVTNFDDGLIYRIPTAVCGVDEFITFDHGVVARPQASQTAVADDPSLRFTQTQRRPFGIGYNAVESRLYYGVWGTSEVWSVDIDPATGLFVPQSSILHFVKPGPRPIAAVSFSPSGHMFLAERTINGDTGTLHTCSRPAHDSRVLEYQLVSGVWTPEPITKYEVGAFGSQTNSAGGVAVDCDDNVWATADAIHFGGSTGHTDIIYGLQRMPAGGNTGQATSTSYVIDFGGFAKAELGQVAIRNDCEDCDFEPDPVLWDVQKGSDGQFSGDAIVTGTFTNLQDTPGTHILLPGNATSPDGVQLCFGSGGNVLSLDPPLHDGDSFEFGSDPSNTIIIKNAQPGDEVCFNLILLGENGEECCTVDVKIIMPPCDCLQVDSREDRFEVVSCEPLIVNFSFELTNLFGQDIYHAFLAPSGSVTFSPDYFDIYALNGNSPLGHGQSIILTTQISGANIGDLVDMLITIHNEDLSECCSRSYEFTIPNLCDPRSFTVVSGSHVAGALPDLSDSDDSDVSVRRSSTAVTALVDVELSARSQTQTPSSISVVLESSVFARTDISQVLSVFNYQTNTFEQVDIRNASRFVDQTTSIELTGDLTRFIEPGTGEMSARVKFVSANPRTRFTTNIDRLVLVTMD